MAVRTQLLAMRRFFTLFPVACRAILTWFPMPPNRYDAAAAAVLACQPTIAYFAATLV